MKRTLMVLLMLTLIFSVFSISALATDSDTMDGAANIALNGSATGRLSSFSDTDFHKITLTQNDIITVSFNYSGSANFTVKLLNSDNQEINSVELADTVTLGSYTFPRYNLPAGDYWVRVDEYRSYNTENFNDYTISVKAEFSGNGTPANRETEYNNGMGEADILTLNTPFTAHQSDFDDSDFFKFTLTKNDIISVDFTYSGKANYTVKLIDSTDTTLDSVEIPDTISLGKYTFSRRNLPPGDYWIRVDEYRSYNDFNNGDYTVTINAEYSGNGVPANRETEYNNGMGDSDILTLNSGMVGNMSDFSDDDFYKITFAQNQTATLKFDYKGNANFTVQLFDSNNNEVAEVEIPDTVSLGSYSFNPYDFAAGTYYVKVSEYRSYNDFNNSDYTVTITDGGTVTTPETTPPVTVTPTPTATVTPTPTPTPTVAPTTSGPNPTDPSAASSASSWAQAEVAEAISLGFVPASLQYGYQNNITRLDFCKLVVQMLMVKSASISNETAFISYYGIDINSDPFTDTSDKYVKIAYDLKIVNGTGDNMFSPYNTITRQEAATMLQRAAAVFEFTNSVGQPLVFADSGSVASWAMPGVNFVSANSIMNGVGDNRFDPLNTYSVEQSILTALRLYKAFPRDSYPVT